MHTVRGTEPKRPAGKRGILDDRADECFDGKSPAQRGSGAGSAGSIAPGGASAGSGGPGVCRGLGGAVRSADALWAGPCAGPCGGLLCSLCGGGRAGGAAARLRGAVAAQRLFVVCAGGCGGCAVGLAGQIPARCAGGLRYVGRHGPVLCAGHWRRGGAGAVLHGRRPAGGAAGAGTAAFPARKTRLWHPAHRGRRGGCAGKPAAGTVLPRGGGVRGGGAGAVQPGTAGGGTGLQRDAGRGPLRRGPGPCLRGRRACLRGGCGLHSGPGPPGGSGCRLCGRLRDGGALRPAARAGFCSAVQRRGGHPVRAGSAQKLAGSCGRTGRPFPAGGARPLPGGGHPAGSRGSEPFVAGRDGERRVQCPAAPVRELPLGH